MKAGNLISFKVIIDERGRLSTELSFFPDSEITNVYTQNYIRNILREAHVKLDPLHDHLEKQLQAL